jgi:hypothetical protein
MTGRTNRKAVLEIPRGRSRTAVYGRHGWRG